MPDLIEALAAELERPRELSARVLNYISGTYGVEDENIREFLIERLPALEEDEIDLILSPVFTPKLADQAVFAEILGTKSVSRDEWPELVRQLARRPVNAQLTTPDGRHHSVVLREVTIERYVYRLRLDAGVSDQLMDLIERATNPTDLSMYKAIARQAVWENPDLRRILVEYLAASAQKGVGNFDDALDLLKLVEGRKPAGIEDLRRRIPAWKEALLQQLASPDKPFFHEQIREMHGGGRDQRDAAAASAQFGKQRELEFLTRLQQLFGWPDVAP